MSKKSRAQKRRAKEAQAADGAPGPSAAAEPAKGLSKTARRRAQHKASRKKAAQAAAEALASRPPKAPKAAPAAPLVLHPVQPLAFAAAEDDHCETAPEAYGHVVPLLHALAAELGVPPAELRIYDPYYCNGAVVRHLAALGFGAVINRNEDFYANVEAGRVPEHDVLLTNPPYTEPHPERLLRFCAEASVPWLALMPNWVCTKGFYGPSLGAAEPGVFYLCPRKRYHCTRRTRLDTPLPRCPAHVSPRAHSHAC